MEIETRRRSVLKLVKNVKNNDVLLQIEALLLEKAKEEINEKKAKAVEELMGFSQNPRKCHTKIEELALKQNYNPKKDKLIGALPIDDLSFAELSKMLGR